MFERFTSDARQTVLLAQEEARALGHNYIGTEHLMLALLAVNPTPIGPILGPYGITHDRVRAEILEIVGRGEGAKPGHIPFTPRSKKVLELSLREALKLKSRTIEPAHILLGLVREGEGVAAQILCKLGVDLERLRPEVLARLGAGKAGGFRVLPPPPLDLTQGGSAALDRARALALGNPVGTQHLLLGLIGEDDSLAARALAALGVTREAVAAQLVGADPTGSPDEPPEQAAARRTSLQVEGGVVTMRLEDADLAATLSQAVRQHGKSVTIRGTDLPQFGQFWRSVRPALEEVGQAFSKQVMAGRLRETRDVSRGTLQGGWTVGEYQVTTEPGGGLRGHLVTNRRFATDAEVRAVLGEWLGTNQAVLADTPGPHRETGCVRLTLQVGRAAEVQSDPPDPDALTVASVAYGPGPAPADWPRLPLADLVAFAVTDLSDGPPGAPESPG